MKGGLCNKELGFYGKETSAALIEYVLESAKENHDGIDAVLLNGDFVKHGVALKEDTGMSGLNPLKRKTWNTIKSIMEQDLKMVREQFPDKPILPVIGNNDVIVHDQVPCSDEVANIYYPERFELWFPEDSVPKDFDRENI